MENTMFPTHDSASTPALARSENVLLKEVRLSGKTWRQIIEQSGVSSGTTQNYIHRKVNQPDLKKLAAIALEVAPDRRRFNSSLRAEGFAVASELPALSSLQKVATKYYRGIYFDNAASAIAHWAQKLEETNEAEAYIRKALDDFYKFHRTKDAEENAVIAEDISRRIRRGTFFLPLEVVFYIAAAQKSTYSNASRMVIALCGRNLKSGSDVDNRALDLLEKFRSSSKNAKDCPKNRFITVNTIANSLYCVKKTKYEFEETV